ncbi:transmembrane protein 135-like [Sitodiplosis mosellana]|uniref:transmembrane protein 135-like n=1 Tax=Sitodiplosis mosellana TaxID=263140 RepID=UPI0024450DB8|nr:transmembrane protein 135-like [Sitodiplosis mosellana]
MSAVQSKLTPISATCMEYVHPWTEHCSVATAGLLLQAAQESFRIYSAVYTLSLLMRCRVPTLNDLKRMLLGILQSTAFLTTSAFSYSFFLCLLRSCIGSFNFYTVSFVPSFMSSMCALLLERPSRRGLLCLYVSNVATETLFNMACARGYCRPIPYGQVLIFGASMSLLLYYFRCGLHQGIAPTIQTNAAHANKDSIYDILRFVVGRYEEYVPALQLQPQFLSRRRERQSSAALLTGQRDPAQSSSHTRPPSKNPFLPVILQAVRYYTQLMDYFKYRLPRHKTCPHPRNSCLHYVVSGGTKLFTIGVGLQMTLILIRLKMTSKLPWREQLKSIFRSSNTLKLGTFLGGFAALFRLSSCSFRHITGKDDPLHAVPAAFLSSIAFASYPDTTVALYVFWKALQISYNIGIDAGYLPKIPHFTFLLYSASTATLFHAATIEPMNLRSSYWKFLHSLSGGRMAAMARVPLDVYGLSTSKQLESVLTATKTSRNINFIL